MKEKWGSVVFHDVCQLKKGRKPILSKYRTENSSPYLVAKYIRGKDDPMYALISDKNSVRVANNEIIIICDGSNSGETFIGYEGILSSTMAKITHIKDIDTYFLQYYLDTLFSDFKRTKTGMAIPHLDLEKLENSRIPFPPFTEQQRIVAILDQAFATIATAKANTEKNLQNVRELFETYLNKIFTNDNNCWDTLPLRKITTKIGSGATPLGGNKTYLIKGVSLVRSLNIHDDGFRYKDLAYISENQAKQLSNVIVEKGDVLLNITGASIARCAIVPDTVLPARVNQHVSIIRMAANTVLPEFIHYELISKEYKRKLLNIGSQGGATRQALTKTIIENLPIRFPASLSEQAIITCKINDLKEQIKKLETVYFDKLDCLEELKSSLLQKAFNGELTEG